MTLPVPVSFEFFPPNTPAGDAKLRGVVADLAALRPEFFSVTYGAGGANQAKTLDTVMEIRDEGLTLPPNGVYVGWATLPDGQRHGAMINIGSTAGIRPRPGLTWYNASKGAVNLMSRSLAVELAPDKIRVNAIAPVIGETALMETFMGVPDTPENRERFMATIPLGRFSKPLDIANATLFLASDEAEFLTGVVLEVDGGRTI